jgi:hypothetical protein
MIEFTPEVIGDIKLLMCIVGGGIIGYLCALIHEHYYYYKEYRDFMWLNTIRKGKHNE